MRRIRAADGVLHWPTYEEEFGMVLVDLAVCVDEVHVC